MKKLLLASAAVVALSGSMFADTIAASTGTMNSVPLTATFNAAQAVNLPWTGIPINTTNTQAPFWNNLSADPINSHVANIGDVLAGLTGVGNVIGGNLSGGNINGSYLAYGSTDNTGGGGDPNNPTTTLLGSTTSATPALAFSFVSNAAAYNIALLFAASSLDNSFPTGTTFGYYTGSGTGADPIVLDPLATPDNHYLSGPPTTIATADVLKPAGWYYGFYATVCYTYTGTASSGTCTASVTYTTGAGNYSNNMAAGNLYMGALGWNHFALFQLASGAEVLGFTGTPYSLTTNPEGIGDFQDLVIGLTNSAVSPVPEPATLGVIGFGLAALGFLGRRRFSKK